MKSRHFFTQRTQLFSEAPERLWALLSDTDNMNRFMGLPAVTYANETPDRELSRRAFTKVMGIRTEWLEFPFEWVQGQKFLVTRLYPKGPIEKLQIRVEIRPEGTGCVVSAGCEAHLRWPGLTWIARWQAGRSMAQMLQYAEKSLARSRKFASAILLPAPLKTFSKHSLVKHRIQFLGQEFAERFAKKLSWIASLENFLCEATDRQVLNLRPFELAAAWKVPRSEVLEFFLFATEQGAFELDWQLQCPNCRVAKDKKTSLQNLSNAFHCDLCGIDIETDLAESVELRFRIHPRLRQANEEDFCLMGPYRSNHIFSQLNLSPGERRAYVLPESEVRCRILGNQTLGTPASRTFASQSPWTWNGVNWTPTGKNTAEIWNNSSQRVTVAIEFPLKDPFAVSAAYVTSLHTFRRLFGSEVLAPGTQVAVRHLCFLFSDLKDSTQMYREVGDAPAFGRVQKHFDYLESLLAKHQGALVKTMGDAIMAVFYDPQDALRCAQAMQEGLEAFNHANQFSPPVVLKLGLHLGPVIAIRNEGILDYFGNTVNYSARIQSQSSGADIVLSHAFHEVVRPQLSSLKGWRAESFRTALKGIGQSETCVRLSQEQVFLRNLDPFAA